MSRTKDQWIEETGGRRFGESDAQFLARVAEIKRINDKIAAGTFTYPDFVRLRELKGITMEFDYDGDDDSVD